MYCGSEVEVELEVGGALDSLGVEEDDGELIGCYNDHEKKSISFTRVPFRKEYDGCHGERRDMRSLRPRICCGKPLRADEAGQTRGLDSDEQPIASDTAVANTSRFC